MPRYSHGSPDCAPSIGPCTAVPMQMAYDTPAAGGPPSPELPDDPPELPQANSKSASTAASPLAPTPRTTPRCKAFFMARCCHEGPPGARTVAVGRLLAAS